MVTAALAVTGVGAWLSTPYAGASSAPDFSVVAGGASATDTPTSEGSSALATKLEEPQAVAVDASGNVVICDTNRNEIEVLAESASNPGYVIGSGANWTPGSMYVVAGNGLSSPAPVTTGSQGLLTAIDSPEGVAIDSTGDVLIADTGDYEVEVLAVSPTNPGYVLGGSSIWARGSLYVIAGLGKSDVSPAPTSAGELATEVGLDLPRGVGIDNAGNVLIADTGNGLVETLAVGSERPGYTGGTVLNWSSGYLYAIAGGGDESVTANGTVGTATRLDQPSGVTVDSYGDVLVADTDDVALEILASSAADPSYSLGSGSQWTPGNLYVLAGWGSNEPSEFGTPAGDSELDSPTGVAVDSSGNVLVADGSDNEVDLLAESASNPGYLMGSGASWTTGNLYLIAGGGVQVPSASGTDALATELGRTDAAAVSPSGGIAITDSSNSEVDLLLRSPGAPVLESATSGDGTVALGWSAPATDGGSPVTGYDVLVFAAGSSDPQETLGFGPDTTSCVVGSLTNGVSYSFEVDAVTAVGTSQPSTTLGAVPQPAPGGFGTGGSGSGGSGSVGSSPNSSGSGKAKSAASKTARPVLARVVLVKSSAKVRSGFAMLSVRCSVRSCSGVVQLVARKTVRLKSHGTTRAVVESVLLSSDHFAVRGSAVASLPVPVTAHAIGEVTSVRNFRIAVTADFNVAKGAKSTHKVRLVAA
ncbi:MAG: fibronectin type III domain-containing protein [Acidimicrobiales bacterium]